MIRVMNKWISDGAVLFLIRNYSIEPIKWSELLTLSFILRIQGLYTVINNFYIRQLNGYYNDAFL